MDEFGTPAPEDAEKFIASKATVSQEWLSDLKDWKEEEATAYIEELKHFAPSVEGLVGSMSEYIKQGRWESIVGDDVRGRATALIVGQVLGRYAREHHTPPPQRNFLATGKDLTEERWTAIKEYVAGKLENYGSRTIFVTEYIESAKTAVKVVRIFSELGITCDIAAATIADSYEDGSSLVVVDSRQKLEEQLQKEIPGYQGKVYVGLQTDGAPDVDGFKNKNILGIRKAEGRPIVESVTQALLQEDAEDEEGRLENAELVKVLNSEQIAPIRQEIQTISNQIYDRTFGGSNVSHYTEPKKPN